MQSGAEAQISKIFNFQYILTLDPLDPLSYARISLDRTEFLLRHQRYRRSLPQIQARTASFKPAFRGPGSGLPLTGDLVLDQLTGLQWLKNANPAEFPLSWQEALDYITRMNREKMAGRTDWRLPNRRELRSLMAFETKKPALPADHPFENVFLGWYWTSTTAAIHPGYAWYVHMEGARMFFGRKDQYYLCWPVCGQGNGIIPATGPEEML